MRKKDANRYSDVLELIHTDICGPFPTPSWNGQQYFIPFIDDYSRYDYLYLIHEKSQSLDVFKNFKAEVENQHMKPSLNLVFTHYFNITIDISCSHSTTNKLIQNYTCTGVHTDPCMHAHMYVHFHTHMCACVCAHFIHVFLLYLHPTFKRSTIWHVHIVLCPYCVMSMFRLPRINIK